MAKLIPFNIFPIKLASDLALEALSIFFLKKIPEG